MYKIKEKFQKLTQFISDCIMPVLPVMLGTGILKVILILLTTFKLLSTDSTTYQIFYGISDSFFYFLPAFMGWSIARRMRGSIPLYMAVGLMLCYPSLVNMMDGTSETVIYGTFLGMKCIYLFNVIPILDTTYTSSVVPMLLMAPIMKKTEEFTKKISPDILSSFLQPLLFFLICIPCLLIIIGPLGSAVGSGIAFVFNEMYNTVPWLSVCIVSALLPFLIMTGMHYALIPLCINNIAILGYDVIVLITMFCSNICQGAAALGICVKTKKKKLKSEGLGAAVSAVVDGIVEPALFGINLKYKTPLIASIFGASISGLLAGFLQIKAYTIAGSPSILSVITFIGEGDSMNSMLLGLVCGGLGFIISFVLSYFLYKDK